MIYFLKKHPRLVSFIGASIVLATFILREVVRDHLKDLANSLDQAQSVFAIQGQLDSTNQRLRWLLNHEDFEITLKQIRRIAKSGPTFEDTKDGIDSLLEQDISVVADLQATQQNLNRLLRKLPSNAYPTDLQGNDDELKRMKEERDGLETKMLACSNANDPTENCSLDFVNEIDKESDALDVKLFWMGRKLRKASGNTLEEAEKELQRREAWYSYANVASVFLFIIGWSLGLVGSLYQVKGLTKQESTEES
jgi:hypothetical protein